MLLQLRQCFRTDVRVRHERGMGRWTYHAFRSLNAPYPRQTARIRACRVGRIVHGVFTWLNALPQKAEVCELDVRQQPVGRSRLVEHRDAAEGGRRGLLGGGDDRHVGMERSERRDEAGVAAQRVADVEEHDIGAALRQRHLEVRPRGYPAQRHARRAGLVRQASAETFVTACDEDADRAERANVPRRRDQGLTTP
jgi:hypothetical protein